MGVVRAGQKHPVSYHARAGVTSAGNDRFPNHATLTGPMNRR
jgi:hypothetical protein